MTAEPTAAIEVLSGQFIAKYPNSAARRLETLPTEDVAEILGELSLSVPLPVWRSLAPGRTDILLPLMSDDKAKALLEKLDSGHAAALLSRLKNDEQKRYLKLLKRSVAKELKMLLRYPPDTAGSMMDVRVMAFRSSATVQEVLDQLRTSKQRRSHQLKLIDENNRLTGIVDVTDLINAESDQTVGSLATPVRAAMQAMDPREDVVAKLEEYKLEEVPVVNLEGEFIGVIRHSALLDALKESTVDSIGAMVGVSKDERALSSSWFTVMKRQPWLQINLLTAFLAAAVVGLFEGTIAKVTALAVLLPVVAGQSGNSGSQALAVTMRGLFLREISLRHWAPVLRKEVMAGLMNGVGIAFTCGIGVFIWSQKIGLVLVITSSMIIAMVAAGVAGALVPILLVRFGQDPAVASSIILTTVTDIAGFFSFLGIATLLMAMLT